MTLQTGDILAREELSSHVGAGGDSCFLHKGNSVVAIAMNGHSAFTAALDLSTADWNWAIRQLKGLFLKSSG